MFRKWLMELPLKADSALQLSVRLPLFRHTQHLAAEFCPKFISRIKQILTGLLCEMRFDPAMFVYIRQVH